VQLFLRSCSDPILREYIRGGADSANFLELHRVEVQRAFIGKASQLPSVVRRATTCARDLVLTLWTLLEFLRLSDPTWLSPLPNFEFHLTPPQTDFPKVSSPQYQSRPVLTNTPATMPSPTSVPISALKAHRPQSTRKTRTARRSSQGPAKALYHRALNHDGVKIPSRPVLGLVVRAPSRNRICSDADDDGDDDDGDPTFYPSPENRKKCRR
jgi:hypothetical protein